LLLGYSAQNFSYCQGGEGVTELELKPLCWIPFPSCFRLSFLFEGWRIFFVSTKVYKKLHYKSRPNLPLAFRNNVSTSYLLLSESIFNLIYHVLTQDWDYLSHNNTQRKGNVIVSKCWDTVFWKTQVKQ